jgi:hypothetical protein
MSGESQAAPKDYIRTWHRYEKDWIPTSHNLSVGFGTVIHQATGKSIGVLVKANGGRRIECWAPDGGCIGGVKSAIDTAGDQLKGMIWFQGESDSEKDDTSPDDVYHWAFEYETKLRALIAYIREYAKKPNLPFLIVQVGSLYRPGGILIRAAQFAVTRDIPYCACIPSYDLGTALHYNAVNLSTIGERLGYAALNIAYGRESHWGPQFKAAYFSDATNTELVVEFDGVKNALKDFGNDPDTHGFFVMDPAQWTKVIDFSYEKYPSMMKPYKAITLASPNKLIIELEQAATEALSVGYGRQSKLADKNMDFVSDDTEIPMPTFFNYPVGLFGTVETVGHHAKTMSAAKQNGYAQFKIYRMQSGNHLKYATLNIIGQRLQPAGTAKSELSARIYKIIP